jgi:hypothetical protein
MIDKLGQPVDELQAKAFAERANVSADVNVLVRAQS